MRHISLINSDMVIRDRVREDVLLPKHFYSLDVDVTISVVRKLFKYGKKVNRHALYSVAQPRVYY